VFITQLKKQSFQQSGKKWDVVGESGKILILLPSIFNSGIVVMINLLGEYDCKMDAKGRLSLPTGLKKQLESLIHEGFVINRDIHEKCLVLYPKKEWEKVSGQLAKLNRFIRKNALFIRKFNNGATPLQVDGSGRILIPKPLASHASLAKEVVVTGNGERVEIWAKEEYNKMLSSEEINFSELAEEVMGDISPTDDE
jgi:MraZ protein